MRILANENFPGATVTALRARSHDVVWARTAYPGARDRAIPEQAQAESRIVATFDKDFGELAFRFGLPSKCGVVLFRLNATSAAALTQTVVSVLESRSGWEGLFAVVREDRIRIRPLPGNSPGTGD